MFRRVGAALLVTSWACAGIAHADPTPPAPRTTIDRDGTYAVGSDIVPGTYSSPGPVGAGACYWKRLAGAVIVDNALSEEAQTVRIDATDTAFKTSRCQPWHLVDCPSDCPPAPVLPPDPLGELKGFLAPHQGALTAPGGP